MNDKNVKKFIMKSKILSGIAIAAVIVIVLQFFYFSDQISTLEIENTELKEQRKTELKQVRDSATAKIDTIIKTSKTKLDSIAKTKIKWRKYEKPIYIDRTLDDALNVHSKYKSNTRTTKTDF